MDPLAASEHLHTRKSKRIGNQSRIMSSEQPPLTSLAPVAFSTSRMSDLEPMMTPAFPDFSAQEEGFQFPYQTASSPIADLFPAPSGTAAQSDSTLYTQQSLFNSFPHDGGGMIPASQQAPYPFSPGQNWADFPPLPGDFSTSNMISRHLESAHSEPVDPREPLKSNKTGRGGKLQCDECRRAKRGWEVPFSFTLFLSSGG